MTNNPMTTAPSTPFFTGIPSLDDCLVVNPEFISEVEREDCEEDYCFICRRPTDHFGEHSNLQLLAARNR